MSSSFDNRALALLLTAGLIGACGTEPPSGETEAQTPSPLPVTDAPITQNPTPSATELAPTATATAAATPSASATPTPYPTPTAYTTPTAYPTPTRYKTPTQPPTPAVTPTPSPTPDLACDPPLIIEPDHYYVDPLDLITLIPTGGSGSYHFEFEDNQSGGILSSSSGAYLSGSEGGFLDGVKISDENCSDAVYATIEVVKPLIIAPTDFEILPGDGLDFEILEGSGAFQCTLVQNDSGAELDADCHYTAGPLEAVDIIIFEDTLTGRTVRVDIQIHGDAGITSDTPRIFLPLGSQYPLAITGASGHYDYHLVGDAIEMDAFGIIHSIEPGEARLEIRDRFTSATLDLPIDVVAPIDFDTHRAGDQMSRAQIHSPGDIDGDGFADAIFGHVEADIAAFNGGAVYIYAGEDGGLSPAPIQTFYGDHWHDEMGENIRTADFDQDGLLDLLISAPRADRGATDNGAVYIHHGVPGGFFSETPTTTLVGDRSSDWLGYALETCDFNADGYLDLVVGAPLDEDETQADMPGSTGALHFYLGGPDGFAPESDHIVYGMVPSDDSLSWIYPGDARIGTTLITGDFNGDGLCDVAAGSHYYDRPQQSNNGVAVIYLTEPPTETHPIHIGPTPNFAIDVSNADNEKSQFARRMSSGDVNGDGIDDLVFSQWLYSPVDGIRRAGAARLFLGSDELERVAPWVDVDEADWTVSGDNSNDYMGFDVKIADYNGDANADLIIGATQDDQEEGQQNTGRLHIYLGHHVLPETTPALSYSPPNLVSGDHAGEAVDIIDDLDGDGQKDWLIVAGRGDLRGPQVGQFYFVGSQDPDNPIILDNEGYPAGSNFGRQVEFTADITGDGQADLLVGAPYADPDAATINWGSVFLFEGEDGAIQTDNPIQIDQFTGHSSGDYLGFGMTYLGDFDGQGRVDFALVSGYDDKPNTFDADLYANADECPGSRANSGAVYIFEALEDGATVANAPRFVYYGHEASISMQKIIGGFDFNGDGLQDFAIGAWSSDVVAKDAGAVAIVYGRPHEGGALQVICEPDIVHQGWSASDNLGRGLASLGDINGDGCDDLAAAGYASDIQGYNNQGMALVLFGMGAPSCGEDLKRVAIAPEIANGQFGFSLAGGQDFDGDGVQDLVVGAQNHLVGSDRPGSVFILSGAGIASREPEINAQGEPSLIHNTESVGVIATMSGKTHQGQFGRYVATVPPSQLLAGPGVLVGEPQSDATGHERTGLVTLFGLHLKEDGLYEAQLAGVLPGEAQQFENKLGEWLSAGTVGDRVMAAAGAHQAEGSGVDQGAVYLLDLGPALEVVEP